MNEGLLHGGCGGTFSLSGDEEGEIVCSKCSLHTTVPIEFFGTCGCGMPEEVAEFAVDLMELIQSGDYDRLLSSFGERPAYFFLYALDRLGLTEHGCSISACWLSRKGEAVLKFWKEHCVVKT